MLRKLILILFTVLVGCTTEDDPMPGCQDVMLQAEAENAVVAGCETTEGVLMLTTTGFTNPTFALDGGTPQSSAMFEGLAQGTYTVSVTDESGCITLVEAQVMSGMTYTDHVRPIIEKSCAVTGCHVAGTGLPQWLIYEVAQSSADRIKAETQSGNMPQTGSLTDEEIAILACWADDNGPL